jgi:hypothetical protein
MGGALAFDTGPSREGVGRLRLTEAPLTGTELMHVAVFPSHRGLQHVMQLCQGCVWREPAVDARRAVWSRATCPFGKAA